MRITQPVQSFASSIVYAYNASDLISKGIVLLLLLLSVYAWTIIAEKSVALGRVRNACRTFMDEFVVADSLLELALREREFAGPLAEAYFAALDEIMNVLGVEASQVDLYCRHRLLPRPLSDHEIQKVKAVVERVLTKQNLLIEERLDMLDTIVTLAPFLGLLGTVWGAMLAFVGMAQQGRSDLVVLAPGLCGALLATVVGLLVAIPAIVGLDAIRNAVKRTHAEMGNFVDDFVAKMRLQKAGNPTGAES
jgi:biopolymer transport protein TolQ